MKNILIVGAGMSGAVLARTLAEDSDLKILVIDAADHVAGNCHTERDLETGIMIHKFGPHIFNTSIERVWKFVNRFAEFHPFINRVKAHTRGAIYSLPVNLHTINQFFGKQFNPSEAREFLVAQADHSISEPQNFEEQALKFLGKELYEAFFKGYTQKQWGCDPRELPASILKRLPVRFNYDDNYYNSRYQGIPVEGYTDMIEKMLDHDQIDLKLSCRFESVMRDEFDHVFYTGPIDQFYGHIHGRLAYRTVFWEREDGEGDMLGNAVINHPEMTVGYTRIHEHKHFAPWESHEKSVSFIEFSKETGEGDIPYYPKRLAGDKAVLDAYGEAAHEDRKVSFLGRLGTYRYLNMDLVIDEAMDLGQRFLKDGDSIENRFSSGELVRPAAQ
jgi:UDP-galactopyranose mutase